ncbi:MAG: hypothetical protein KAJ40_05695, partial [Alphaproteobacteria bacterium]|nr:hypothetical protein [Alphaproteobacteria bacterium]
ADVTNCCVCGKFISDNDCWICETCGGEHHPQCSGYARKGFGEYPHETEMSICKNCTDDSPHSSKSERASD